MKLENYQGWKSINPFKKRALLFKLHLAKQYGKLVPAKKQIIVAGSLGKTTTLTLANSILSSKYKTVITEDKGGATINKVLSLGDAFLKVGPKTEKVLIEINLEESSDIDLYLDFVKLNTLVMTKIIEKTAPSFDELEQMNDVNASLLRQLPKDGVLILDWDDPISRRLQEKSEASTIFYGFDEKNCHVWAGNMRISNLQTIFELNYGVERVEIVSKLLGFHQIYPVLAASALALNLGMNLVSIKKGIEKVNPLPGRMEVINGHSGSIIINDTYEGYTKSFEQAMDTLDHIPARRRIVVLGEMDVVNKKAYSEIARKIYKEKIDLVLLGTGDARYIANELSELGFISERMLTDLQNPGFVSNLLKILARGDVVLIKGSSSLKLSEVVKKITREK